MSDPHPCPLCRRCFEGEPAVRVHLEVEHRKSELAMFAVEHHEDEPDGQSEREVAPPTV